MIAMIDSDSSFGFISIIIIHLDIQVPSLSDQTDLNGTIIFRAYCFVRVNICYLDLSSGIVVMEASQQAESGQRIDFLRQHV